MKILVTGSTGFVGSALIQRLCNLPSTEIVVAIRATNKKMPDSVIKTYIQNIDCDTDWGPALNNVDIVVHAAARVHVMTPRSGLTLEDFWATNVEGTLRLAHQAISAGAKRFIFLSSIKVNGESSPPECAFSANDVPHPSDPYAVSKYEAEQKLMQLSDNGLIEVVIIRPVLVYGAGVGANFFQMLRWLKMGFPLPFGAVNNRRSLVSLDNLVDLIVTCLDHPRAAHQVFLVSDGQDLSTTELMRCLAAHLGAKTWLVPVPPKVLEFVLGLLGRHATAQRLCGSLQVDITKNHEVLGWRPPVSLDDGLKSTAKHFLESLKR